MRSTEQNAPFEDARDEKRRALRVLKEDREFPEECFELVEFIATPTIEDPHFHTTRAAICQHVLEIVLDDERPEPKHLRQAHALLNRTRIELAKAYERPETKISPFRIRLKKGNRETGIRVAFNRRKKRTVETDLDFASAANEGAARLWRSMIGALDAATVFLIFDTPEVGLANTAIDRRGWWAGSGEVAAAFLLGQCFARLDQRLRLKRWRDMDHDDLTGAGECLIILGSSINNPWLRRLRERERWIGLQAFHFEPPAQSDSRGCICKGSLRTPEMREVYQHKEAAEGDAEADYALVSCFHDTAYKQTLIALQGITTAGTHAAAVFMCDDDYVAALRDFLRERHGCDLSKGSQSFEALLRVHINDGLPVDITLVDSVVYRSTRRD